MSIKDFPAGLKSLLASGWCKVRPAVHIKLSPTVTMKYSNMKTTFNSDVYQNRLYLVGTIKKSQEASVDRVELTLDNADGETGLIFVDPVNALNNAEATLYKIYENIRNPLEKYRVERISGVLRNAKATQDKFVTLSLIGDGYAGGTLTEYDVRPTCVYIYKDGYNCSYNGNIPDCDLTYDGANGCINHNGEDGAKAMFGGHGYFLDESTIQQVASNAPISPALSGIIASKYMQPIIDDDPFSGQMREYPYLRLWDKPTY